MNSAVPVDLHEKIYNNSLKNINREFGSLSHSPGNAIQIIEDLARSTTSIKLIKQMHDFNDPRIDRAMLDNQAVQADMKKRIKERQKERRPLKFETR